MSCDDKCRMRKFLTLDSDNYLINSVYVCENNNIKILDNDVENDYCFVYCSSNNLYIKDNQVDFLEKIVRKNRYEWVNRTAEIVPKREIFIRDVWLSWYARGINSKVDTIDKLIDYIAELTAGFNVVTCGVSSGGFIATALAIKLSAVVKVYNFSGQFSLGNHFDHIKINPFMSGGQLGEYEELYKMLPRVSSDIYYFYPSKSKQDIIQSSFVKGENKVLTFSVNSSRHGVTLLPINLPRVISNSKEEMLRMYNNYSGKKINRFIFSIRLSGWICTFKFYYITGIRLVKEKCVGVICH